MKLSNYNVKIDYKDWLTLRKYNWRQITPNPKRPKLKYLVRNSTDGSKRVTVYLHHDVMDRLRETLPDDIKVRTVKARIVFANGDTMDYRRENLRWLDNKLGDLFTKKAKRCKSMSKR